MNPEAIVKKIKMMIKPIKEFITFSKLLDTMLPATPKTAMIIDITKNIIPAKTPSKLILSSNGILSM
jgi:hypothetical protein